VQILVKMLRVGTLRRSLGKYYGRCNLYLILVMTAHYQYVIFTV